MLMLGSTQSSLFLTVAHPGERVGELGLQSCRTAPRLLPTPVPDISRDLSHSWPGQAATAAKSLSRLLSRFLSLVLLPPHRTALRPPLPSLQVPKTPSPPYRPRAQATPSARRQSCRPCWTWRARVASCWTRCTAARRCTACWGACGSSLRRGGASGCCSSTPAACW